MFLLARAAIYVTLFVSLVLIELPARLLAVSRIGWPQTIGPVQKAGMLLAGAGAALALWCVLALVFVGKGTPAPFDPPRQLVVGGPYRYSRNPMYLGTGSAVLGAALFYQSLPLFSYGVALSLAAYLFVIGYEEPILRDTFRHSYPDYCGKVRRWVGRTPADWSERSGR